MILRGSLERLAPVLMTALTAGFGLLPLVLGGQEPGREILYPVATVILGGLITSTFCEFLIHPGIFWRFSGKDAQANSHNSKNQENTSTHKLTLFRTVPNSYRGWHHYRSRPSNVARTTTVLAKELPMKTSHLTLSSVAALLSISLTGRLWRQDTEQPPTAQQSGTDSRPRNPMTAILTKAKAATVTELVRTTERSPTGVAASITSNSPSIMTRRKRPSTFSAAMKRHPSRSRLRYFY